MDLEIRSFLHDLSTQFFRKLEVANQDLLFAVQGFMRPLLVSTVFVKDLDFIDVVTPIGAIIVVLEGKFSKLAL